PFTSLPHRLEASSFGHRKGKRIRGRNHRYSPEWNGALERSFPSQRQSQWSGRIDNRDLKFAAGHLIDGCRSITAEHRDRPGLSALFSQVDPGLVVRPLRTIDELRGYLEDEMGPNGIS